MNLEYIDLELLRQTMGHKYTATAQKVLLLSFNDNNKDQTTLLVLIKDTNRATKRYT